MRPLSIHVQYVRLPLTGGYAGLFRRLWTVAHAARNNNNNDSTINATNVLKCTPSKHYANKHR